MSFYKSPRNELDPLDNEILERALDATRYAIKTTGQHFDAESDEELEAALRRELIEIARLNGVSDPETLKDILLASMQPSRACEVTLQIELRMRQKLRSLASLSLRFWDDLSWQRGGLTRG